MFVVKCQSWTHFLSMENMLDELASDKESSFVIHFYCMLSIE